VREAHVEGAPTQRFGRVGEWLKESESELELGTARSRFGSSFEGDGEKDIVPPLWWISVVA
jgi:hypothetical protein